MITNYRVHGTAEVARVKLSLVNLSRSQHSCDIADRAQPKMRINEVCTLY